MIRINKYLYHIYAKSRINEICLNNFRFGCTIRSQSTGIILNDEMDDFSTPGKTNGFGLRPSPANFIAPNKRPLSSMCPVIVLDENNDVIFIAGSAGGSKITSTVAYVSAMTSIYFYSIVYFFLNFNDYLFVK